EPRIGVILAEPAEIMVERVESGGGEDARLAQRAAEHAPRPRRARDVALLPGEKAADRAAEPLRQRDRDEIEGRREGPERRARGRRGVEEPRAVEIARNAERT